MGATDELHPHRCRLSPQHPGKNAIHQITALITMAIASEGSKVLRPQALLSKRSQNTLQALFNS